MRVENLKCEYCHLRTQRNAQGKCKFCGTYAFFTETSSKFYKPPKSPKTPKPSKLVKPPKPPKIKKPKKSIEEKRAHKSKYTKQKLATDLEFRLCHALRSRLCRAVKNNQKNGSAIRHLGCSISEFKQHIETLWKPGMTWENWARSGWHIDHIIPLSAFDLTDPAQFIKACHYTNLQPLWASENFKKGGSHE